MGRIHIMNILETRYLRITANCSVISAEIEWARDSVPEAELFTSFEEFISEEIFDAVLKVIPNGLHAALLLPTGSMHSVRSLSLLTLSAWTVYHQSLKCPHLKVAADFLEVTHRRMSQRLKRPQW
ncbi:hypothetical protein V1505DRAFT_381823 [Lipomyces doorenjongii]